MTVLAFIGVCSVPAAGHCQGWGEQISPQFRYSNQGLTNEIYRQQFSAAATARAQSSTSGGGGGSGQGASELNNVVQINNNSVYNISVSGDSNEVGVDNLIDAAQKSEGTQQTSTNAGFINATSRDDSAGVKFLNK